MVEGCLSGNMREEEGRDREREGEGGMKEMSEGQRKGWTRGGMEETKRGEDEEGQTEGQRER